MLTSSSNNERIPTETDQELIIALAATYEQDNSALKPLLNNFGANAYYNYENIVRFLFDNGVLANIHLPQREVMLQDPAV